MPHDSIAGRWWCLISSPEVRIRIPDDARIADEVGELQWDPWVEDHDFFVAHPDEADAS